MRSLETNEQREARRKKKVQIISYMLLLIMLLSTIGYGFILFSENNPGNNRNNPDNNGQIQTDSGQWVTNFGNQRLIMQSSKEAVKNITVDVFLDINAFKQAPVYIASGNNSYVYQELAYNMNPFTYKMPAEACYGPCSQNLPEKNCSDYLIVYNKSDSSKVYQQDNCVFIEGDMRAVDAFLYKIFE